ncbi:hypothetical protein Cgig2_007464 [Carnegiea gigantea]|uniref:Uncharacterized protein n=1 Tax=Carnegiea gigantea TaxID=171969 RepID=A0A9Q1QCW2_9CARY|nr:hypothetical protein Cgig2_007464 [Carnegiea gigantea]
MDDPENIMPVNEEPCLEREDAGESAQVATTNLNMEKAQGRDNIMQRDNSQHSTPLLGSRAETRMQQKSLGQAHAVRSSTYAVSAESGPKIGPSPNNIPQPKNGLPPRTPAPPPGRQPTRTAHMQRNENSPGIPYHTGSSSDSSPHNAVTGDVIGGDGRCMHGGADQYGSTCGRDGVARIPRTGNGGAGRI